jgi:CheY-like chemotaxis protein
MAMMEEKVILVVDDEITVREVVQVCLEDLGGWQVLLAPSAQEGLKLAATKQPDAIILDISMPGMDGFAFLDRLKKNPNSQSIPVVLLTAKALWFSQHQLKELKVAGAISKPFNALTLSETIASLLEWQ